MKNLLGPWYVGTLSVPVKCKYVQIHSNISPVITLANAITDISLSLSLPHSLTVPLSTELNLYILFILTDVRDFTNDLNEKRLPRTFLYCSAFL